MNRTWGDPDRTHAVDVGGLRLRVYEWRGAGPVVLLHHGFLDQGRSWDPVAAQLASQFRVLALDARGHGRSGWVGRGGAYYFFDYVRDLEVIRRRLAAAAPWCLVGHSMGGMAVSLYAGAFPEHVAALVSIEGFGAPAKQFEDAPGVVREWVEAWLRREKRAPRRMRDFDTAVTRLRTANPALTPAFARHLARHATRRVRGGGRVWRFDPRHRTPSAVPFYLEQAQAFWRCIRAPALLVRGTHSALRTRNFPGRETIPGAREVALKETGHMVHHERPEALATVLHDFLETALPSA